MSHVIQDIIVITRLTLRWSGALMRTSSASPHAMARCGSDRRPTVWMRTHVWVEIMGKPRNIACFHGFSGGSKAVLSRKRTV